MTIAVLGDLITDVYVYGTVERISPEAPVPILKAKTIESKQGGAGLVYTNILSLTKDVVMCTRHHENIPVKNRYIADGHYLLRVDYENEDPGWYHTDEYKTADIIVVSDYDKGAISSFDFQGKTIVDPKKPLAFYKNAWCIKPNKKEFIHSEGPWMSEKDLELLMRKSKNSNNFTHLIVTLGPDGVAYIGPEDRFYKIPSEAIEVYDVTGAGDTFTAVLAYGLDQNMTMFDAIRLANRASGIAVSHKGTYTITRKDLGLENSQSVVFTNGCFDILHKGHIEYLRSSRSLGDRLIVGLNSDSSVKKLKGHRRPINNQEDRKFMLEQLPFVDEVIIFDEETPYRLIQQIRPSIITKGGDYDPQNVVGNDLARVVIIPYSQGYSTTGIIERMADEIRW